MIRHLSRVAATGAGLATLAIVLLVSFDVLMRFFLDRPQLFVDEVASFLQVLVIFAGLAQTFRVGGHVRVDLVTSHQPARVRAWLRAVCLVLGLAFLLIVIWTTARSTLAAHAYGRVSAVMLYPIWVPMLFIPAGLLLMAMAMLRAFVRQLRALRSRGADEVSLEGNE